MLLSEKLHSFLLNLMGLFPAYVLLNGEFLGNGDNYFLQETSTTVIK